VVTWGASFKINEALVAFYRSWPGQNGKAPWKLFLTNPFRPKRQTWGLHAKKHKGTWLPRVKERRRVLFKEHGPGSVQERSWRKQKPEGPEDRHACNLNLNPLLCPQIMCKKENPNPTHAAKIWLRTGVRVDWPLDGSIRMILNHKTG